MSRFAVPRFLRVASFRLAALYVIVFALRDVLGLAGQSDQYVVDNVDLVHKQP